MRHLGYLLASKSLRAQCQGTTPSLAPTLPSDSFDRGVPANSLIVKWYTESSARKGQALFPSEVTVRRQSDEVSIDHRHSQLWIASSEGVRTDIKARATVGVHFDTLWDICGLERRVVVDHHKSSSGESLRGHILGPSTPCPGGSSLWISGISLTNSTT